MTTSGRGRGVHFGILGAAAVALLAAFLLRDAGDRTAIERPVAKTSQSSPGVAPFPDLKAPEVAAPETPRQAAESAPAAKPGQPPAAAKSPVGSSEDEDAAEAAFEAKIRTLHGERPLTADHPNVASAIEIQERNTGWLMAHPAVVGTGVGLNDRGEIAIVVMTKVAGATDLPAVLEGLPVVVSHTGPIVARNRAGTQDAAPGRADVEPLKPPAGGESGTSVDTTARYRPAPIGVSTGHPKITAGTIGCRLTDGTNVFALSNNHVYADENRASIGDNALQPGAYDGGQNPGDAIGTLAAFEPIVFSTSASNTYDAAIALSSTSDLGNATPSNGYGTPRSTTAAPAVRLSVKKYGRTTQLTSAKISYVNVTVNVGYDSGVARFVGQFWINGGSFSAGGDSGSLIVTGDKRPVGLLFAGGASGTVGSPIGPVLIRFGVTVDGPP